MSMVVIFNLDLMRRFWTCTELLCTYVCVLSIIYLVDLEYYTFHFKVQPPHCIAPKLVHHKNKLEACLFNLCRKVFLKISPHFSSQTTNAKLSLIIYNFAILKQKYEKKCKADLWGGF